MQPLNGMLGELSDWTLPMPAITTDQPALINGQTAIHIRTDQIGANVVLYYCLQVTADIFPFKLDGVPYSTQDILDMDLQGTQSAYPVTNGTSATDIIFLVMRRGAYKVVHDLAEVKAESSLLGVLPEGLIEVQISLMNEAPVAVLSSQVLSVDAALT